MDVFEVLMSTLAQRGLATPLCYVANLAPAAKRAQVAKGTLNKFWCRFFVVRRFWYVDFGVDFLSYVDFGVDFLSYVDFGVDFWSYVDFGVDFWSYVDFGVDFWYVDFLSYAKNLRATKFYGDENLTYGDEFLKFTATKI